MRAELSWIETPWQGRLAISPRPRGGDWLEDEVREWRLAGVEVVVSLLTSDEITDLDLAQEARLCRENGIQYLSFPIADRDVPASRRATLELAKQLETLLAAGKTVAIHCRQGIGRSALIAACVLILAGVGPELAFERLSAAPAVLGAGDRRAAAVGHSVCPGIDARVRLTRACNRANSANQREEIGVTAIRRT